MNKTYKAKIINIDGKTVTYEYQDSSGFVQISSLKPSGINVRKGDIVWITIDGGVVTRVGKRKPALSSPFAVKLIGALVLIVVLLVLWLIFFVLKKVLIAVAWIAIIAIAAVWLFTRFR